MLKTSQGTEYPNIRPVKADDKREMGRLLEKMGITHLQSTAHSDESNRLTESLNRKFQDSMPTIPIHARFADREISLLFFDAGLRSISVRLDCISAHRLNVLTLEHGHIRQDRTGTMLYDIQVWDGILCMCSHVAPPMRLPNLLPLSAAFRDAAYHRQRVFADTRNFYASYG